MHPVSRSYPRTANVAIGRTRIHCVIRIGNRMRTIAVIDDHPSMLQGLDRLLSAHGFRVQAFPSAESFLDDIANCEADCLLLDIHLGGMSGIDLKRRLKSSCRCMPMRFTSAMQNGATRQGASEARCVSRLRTPLLAT